MTLSICLAALVLRTPIQARYWAWRIERADSLAVRDACLGALCSAGDAGRWGVAALLDSEEAELRQYGVLVLHHLRTAWAREQLLERLVDPDPDIQRLAAVGLAIQGDEAVIPALKWLYRTGDANAAASACVAFEYLGTPEAVATLNELAAEPGDPARRAALVDALAGIGTAECVPGLLSLLSDDRLCDVPLRSDVMAQRALGFLQGEGYALKPSSRPTTAESPRTIAERAAAALVRITELRVPFSSSATAEQRAQAEQAWAAWYENQQSGSRR